MGGVYADEIWLGVPARGVGSGSTSRMRPIRSPQAEGVSGVSSGPILVGAGTAFAICSHQGRLSCSHPKAAPGSMADGHSERAEILPGAPASTHESDDSLVLTERCGCGRRHRQQGARSSRLIGARRDGRE